MIEQDFRKELIAKLEAEVPDLKDKIQAGAVDAGTSTPFAAFTTPEERPIITKCGTAGWETFFEIAIYDGKYSGAQNLKYAVFKALSDVKFAGKTCRFRSAAYEYYVDYDLHCWSLTFKIV